MIKFLRWSLIILSHILFGQLFTYLLLYSHGWADMHFSFLHVNYVQLVKFYTLLLFGCIHLHALTHFYTKKQHMLIYNYWTRNIAMHYVTGIYKEFNWLIRKDHFNWNRVILNVNLMESCPLYMETYFLFLFCSFLRILFSSGQFGIWSYLKEIF